MLGSLCARSRHAGKRLAVGFAALRASRRFRWACCAITALTIAWSALALAADFHIGGGMEKAEARNGGGNGKAEPEESRETSMPLQPPARQKVEEKGLKELPTAKIMWKKDIGGLCFFTPAENMLLVTNTTGKVMALEADTGRVLWSFTTGGWIASRPLYAADKVFIGSADHCLYALDSRSGRPLWRFQALGEIISPPTFYEGALFFVCDNNQVFDLKTYVYALDASSGSLLWSRETPGWVTTSPCPGPHGIILTNYSRDIISLSGRNGLQQWSVPASGLVFKPPLVEDGVVYVVSLGGAVQAMREESGVVAWSCKINDFIWAPPLISGDNLVLASNSMAFYALDPTNGEWRWSTGFDDTLAFPPQIEGEYIYAFSGSGRIYRIFREDGSFSACWQVNGSLSSAPLIWRGKLFCGSHDGSLCAYSLPEVQR